MIDIKFLKQRLEARYYPHKFDIDVEYLFLGRYKYITLKFQDNPMFTDYYCADDTNEDSIVDYQKFKVDYIERLT